MSDRSFLEELGFSGCEEQELARVAWPREAAAQGKGAAPLVMALAWLSQAPAWPAGVSADAIGGTLAVVDKTQIVRYQPLAHLAMPQVHAGGITPSVVEDAEHGLVFVSLAESGAVLELSDGRCLSLRSSSDGKVVISELRLPVQPWASVPAPDLDTAAQGTDLWVSEAVAAHLGRRDDWHNAVAAGIWARCGPMPSIPAFRASESAAHRWVAGLSTEQLASVLERSIARIDGLWGELEALSEALAPDDDEWRNAAVGLCRKREDLEGVRVLMTWQRAGDRLEDVLGPFDSAARRFIRSVPVRFSIDDPRLRRAAIVNPAAWWIHLQPESHRSR